MGNVDQRNTSSTRPETRWQWHHWDVLGTFSPWGGPVALCPAGGWDTIGYPLEPPPPTPVLRDSAEQTCSTSSVLVAFECPTGQPYPGGPGKLRKHQKTREEMLYFWGSGWKVSAFNDIQRVNVDHLEGLWWFMRKWGSTVKGIRP